MLTSSVICRAITFFVTRKCQENPKERRKETLLTEKIFIFSDRLEEFNDDIFRKDATFDNIKIKIKKKEKKYRASFSL